MSVAALFLWLSLRDALASGDLAPLPDHAATIRRRLLLLLAMTCLVLVLVVLAPALGMWWLVMYLVVSAGLSLPSLLAAESIVALVAFAMACAYATTGELDVTLLTLAAFGAGATAVRQLTISLGQLRVAREELARLAVAEQRLRFARDLHDLLGHSLSMIVLKSELAGRLLPQAPQRAEAEVRDIEVSARSALRQVREAVAGYRQPTLRSELAAAREVLAAAGIAAHVEDGAPPLPAAVDTLLAWAVREGVTNVVRHSRARTCAIRVAADGAIAQVEITDDGGGVDQAVCGGSGLAGLAERAAARHGCMRAGPPLRGLGFQLLVEAPLASEATPA
jgi:two-component system sensor histidine kinase DesK